MQARRHVVGSVVLTWWEIGAIHHGTELAVVDPSAECPDMLTHTAFPSSLSLSLSFSHSRVLSLFLTTLSPSRLVLARLSTAAPPSLRLTGRIPALSQLATAGARVCTTSRLPAGARVYGSPRACGWQCPQRRPPLQC